MIREKSGCVIFAHAYLLMSQTSQQLQGFLSLAASFGLGLRLHDKPATIVGWQLFLACSVQPQILRRHYWASCMVASVLQPSRHLRKSHDNFLQLSATREKSTLLARH